MRRDLQQGIAHCTAADLTVHAFPECAVYAREVARALGCGAAAVKTHRFPDGEALVRVSAPAPPRAILVRPLNDPDGKIFEVLLAADALRRAGAERVILAAPYLPYMRQDTVFHDGEPVSQRVLGTMLGRAFDGVVTLAPHLHRVRSLADVIPCDARALSPAPALARWVSAMGKDWLVVGPDEESSELARTVAEQAGLSWIAGEKTRLGDRKVRVRFGKLPDAARALVIDDIASSGVTLAAAIKALKRAGAKAVDAAVVHAIFADGAISAIRSAGARQIVSCDTIAHRSNAIPTAPLIAKAVEEML